ncbi:hypothetical protein N657DRAFT_238162 [Parathielavia appendiculata]|uniref:Uncharacterized protein n=1 Tax=Parathielavia appendiculata TaxID=2587402 RepID=A0AAN6Z801_9PEZI|nr:hypothetical protein N657DRAFT_238162 [Parathielavia appendiculata]
MYRLHLDHRDAASTTYTSTFNPRTSDFEKIEQRRISMISTLPSTICNTPFLQSMNQKEGMTTPTTNHTQSSSSKTQHARTTKTTAIYSYMTPQSPTSTLHLSLSPPTAVLPSLDTSLPTKPDQPSLPSSPLPSQVARPTQAEPTGVL